MFKSVISRVECVGMKAYVRVTAAWGQRRGELDGLTVGMIALAVGVVGALALGATLSGSWKSAATWIAGQIGAAE